MDRMSADFKGSPIGHIPKDWECEQLRQIALVSMGSSPSSSSYNENCDGLPLIQGNADIKNRLSAPRIYTSEITRECKPDDILMTVRAPVGYVAKSRHNGCIGRGICSIRPSKIESEYLYQYLIGYEQSWKKLEYSGPHYQDSKSTNLS